VGGTHPGGAETARLNLARQRELYGEVLADRVRRLLVAFDLSQTQLASVVGISPTMLSQVVNGRRQKIANPAVLARMTLLERRAVGADAGRRAAVLEEVRATSVPEAVEQAGDADRVVVSALRAELAGEDLQACAEAVRPLSPALAELLEQAAR
jgi:transcriptional regulator with XRE-family HTH domain